MNITKIFGKRWSPGPELIIGKNISTPPTLKIDLSDHPFIKDNIFSFDVSFSSRGIPIGIVAQYCEHHNMSYISQSTNNNPWNHSLTARNRTSVWILILVRKESTTVQHILEAVSIQQLTPKCIKVHVITAHKDKNIVRTNIQSNICINNTYPGIWVQTNYSSLKTYNIRSHWRCIQESSPI